MMSQTNIHLLQQNYTTVSAVYLNEIEIEEILSLAEGEIVSDYYKAYTFKANLDLQLKVGDFAVVHSRNALQVVQITQVDAQPNLDLNASFQYKWVVDKVNIQAFKQRMQEQKQFELLLKQLDYVEQQHQLVERLEQASQKDSKLAELWQKLKS